MSRTIELVGPAGAGKTTLVASLAQLGFRCRPPAPIPTSAYLRHALSNLVAHVPAMARARTPTGWPELRSAVYLSAWLDELSLREDEVSLREEELSPAPPLAEGGGEVVVYDHGPLYRIATLGWFGRPPCQAEWRGQRGERAARLWADALDLVVLLDAPDDVLIERIERRDQDHLVKGRPETEARAFLARYRSAFDEIVARFDPATGPTVLHLDTRTPPHQLARAVANALSKVEAAT